MGLSIIQVDAFTNRPFAGNPAAVCVLKTPKDAGWMQAVAREMNLSETAFLRQREDGYDLRWFTPTMEVDLCGHATLASAHVLWEEEHLPQDRAAHFQTRSGLLKAERVGDWIELDFPAEPEAPASAPPELVEALHLPFAYVGKNRLDYLVVVEREEQVRELHPDFALLSDLGTRGVIVTAPSESEDFDFVSRYFAPGSGIPEDPVTGSTHCCLGPYWGKRLAKMELVGYQASARGGTVRVRNQGDRVVLGGQAVTVMRGELV